MSASARTATSPRTAWTSEKGRAAIYEVDRLTGAKRIYATGMRNPTGLAFEPRTGNLFAIVNERDEIGPDLVPDYLTSVQGRRLLRLAVQLLGPARGRPRPSAAAGPGREGDQARLRPQLACRGARPGLQPGRDASRRRFADGAFIGEHGSWDREPLNGYKVIFVPFANGRPNGMPIPVVTDFLAADNKTVRGRPVGVALDRTGALIVADDVGNAVWRVSSAAARPPGQ